MDNIFKIKGMSCGHCIMAIKKELDKLNLSDYKVEIGTVIIDTDKSHIPVGEILNAIEKAGYKVIDSDLKND